MFFLWSIVKFMHSYSKNCLQRLIMKSFCWKIFFLGFIRRYWWLNTAITNLKNFYMSFLRNEMVFELFPFMETKLPYMKAYVNFEVAFLRNYVYTFSEILKAALCRLCLLIRFRKSVSCILGQMIWSRVFNR